jgi:ubiquinone/menaquinone biosynthesis C-methylase UbiE
MFFRIAIPILAGGAALAYFDAATWVWGLGVLLMVIAVVPLALGIMMRLYAWRGKVRTRDWVLSRHAWRGDETVLDIGAGRGLMTIGAARLAPSGTAHAIDIWRAEDLTDNGEAGLRKNITAAGLQGNIQIHTMDARSLSFPDSSVDVILSLLCLHNIEVAKDRQAACQEIARVLKPGGVAYIADYSATRSYADMFRAQGLTVTGPINAIPVALSLMFLVEARKSIA